MPRSRSYSRSHSPALRKTTKTSHRRSRSKSRGRKSSHRSPDRRRSSRTRSKSPSRHKSSSSKSKSSRHHYKRSSRSPYRHERRSSDRRRRRSSSRSSSEDSRPNGRSDSSQSSSHAVRSPLRNKTTTQNKIRLEKTPPPAPKPSFRAAMQYLDTPVMPETLDVIDADGFAPRAFISKKIPDKVLIDLSSQTISVPKIPEPEPDEDPLFHQNVTPNSEYFLDYIFHYFHLSHLFYQYFSSTQTII